MVKRTKQKIGFWRSQLDAFKYSFTACFTKRFLKAALFDFITIVSILIILNLAVIIINTQTADILPQLYKTYELRNSEDTLAFESAIVELSPSLNRVMMLAILTITISALLIIFFISWFYGKAWLMSSQKPFGIKFLKKYFVVNLIWFMLWFLVLLLTINIFVTTAAFLIILIEFLLFFYGDPLLRAVFDSNKKVKENISLFLRQFVRIHKFIIFLLASIILGVILLLVLGLLISIPVLLIIVTIIFATAYLGWIRNYISSISDHA